ncbi:hypothetical protein O181_020858, partial [Austropuccinia psidii MF-1]|nr:hypothetical protein [Austropuccinia psidii MF-1]
MSWRIGISSFLDKPTAGSRSKEQMEILGKSWPGRQSGFSQSSFAVQGCGQQGRANTRCPRHCCSRVWAVGCMRCSWQQANDAKQGANRRRRTSSNRIVRADRARAESGLDWTMNSVLMAPEEWQAGSRVRLMSEGKRLPPSTDGLAAAMEHIADAKHWLVSARNSPCKLAICLPGPWGKGNPGPAKEETGESSAVNWVQTKMGAPCEYCSSVVGVRPLGHMLGGCEGRAGLPPATDDISCTFPRARRRRSPPCFKRSVRSLSFREMVDDFIAPTLLHINQGCHPWDSPAYLCIPIPILAILPGSFWSSFFTGTEPDTFVGVSR